MASLTSLVFWKVGLRLSTGVPNHGLSTMITGVLHEASGLPVFQKSESGICPHPKTLAWKCTKYHFCDIVWVKVATEPTKIQRGEYRASALNERNMKVFMASSKVHSLTTIHLHFLHFLDILPPSPNP